MFPILHKKISKMTQKSKHIKCCFWYFPFILILLTGFAVILSPWKVFSGTKNATKHQKQNCETPKQTAKFRRLRRAIRFSNSKSGIFGFWVILLFYTKMDPLYHFTQMSQKIHKMTNKKRYDRVMTREIIGNNPKLSAIQI